MTQNIGRRKTVDFQGSLEVLSIESILQLLYYTNLSGKLILLKPPAKASLFFNKGTLTWGSLHSHQKQLGRRLIDSDLITETQLEECLSIHLIEKQQTRLGRILTEKGFLQTDMLHESLKAQVRDAFFEILTWDRGTFAFFSDISPDEEMILNERVDHLLLEGIIRIDDNSALNESVV